MENPYIKENEEGVISFDLLKIEHGIKKICKCETPHYEIDKTNRLVLCRDCGAIIEPLEALITICKWTDSFTEYQNRAIEKTIVFQELANKELRRRLKNAAFKDMDEHYKENLHPHCPKCGEQFNPIKIDRWSSAKEE